MAARMTSRLWRLCFSSPSLWIAGKESKKQAKLGLPSHNLKKDKQQRKRELQGQVGSSL